MWRQCLPPGQSAVRGKMAGLIIMYIFHVLIHALNAHMIHTNLNTIFNTPIEQSPTETVYMKYYLEQNLTDTHTCMHTHTHTYTYSHVHAHTNTHTLTHAHTHERTCTHTHTHTHELSKRDISCRQMRQITFTWQLESSRAVIHSFLTHSKQALCEQGGHLCI